MTNLAENLATSAAKFPHRPPALGVEPDVRPGPTLPDFPDLPVLSYGGLRPGVKATVAPHLYRRPVGSPS